MSHSAADESSVVTKHSARSVGDTVSLLTELIKAKGMRLFATIDQSAEARRVGLELRETVLVIFGDPGMGTAVMADAPLAALDLPLKTLIWADGDRTGITYTVPAEIARRYGLTPDLTAKLAGIEALTDALSSAVASGR
ncbi:DUF302 domain-containing protein [Leekyejoonella antrihumi]|nr:DUF302 domain-containing protein [Leekyejoonella antrihumi]